LLDLHRTRTTNDQEKPWEWEIMSDLWPNYNVCQTPTNRIIPPVSIDLS